MAHLARVSRDLDSQLITLLRWEHAAAPDGFSWSSQAVTYLDLLRPFMAALREWPRPVLEDMLSCFRQHAGAILKKLSDLRRHIRVVKAAYGPVWVWADAAHRQVAECFGPYGDPSLPPAASPAPRFQCPECSASFHDLRRLQAHRTGRHGYRAPHYKWAAGSRCPICLSDRHTRERLIRHWRSPRCSCFAEMRR